MRHFKEAVVFWTRSTSVSSLLCVRRLWVPGEEGEAARDSELGEDQRAALSDLCGLVLEQTADSLGSRWNGFPLSLLSINIISSEFSVRPQFFLSYITSIISKIIREMMKGRIWKIAIDSTIGGVACFPADSWFMDAADQGQGSVLKACLEEFPRALGSC